MSLHRKVNMEEGIWEAIRQMSQVRARVKIGEKSALTKQDLQGSGQLDQKHNFKNLSGLISYNRFTVPNFNLFEYSWRKPAWLFWLGLLTLGVALDDSRIYYSPSIMKCHSASIWHFVFPFPAANGWKHFTAAGCCAVVRPACQPSHPFTTHTARILNNPNKPFATHIA